MCQQPRFRPFVHGETEHVITKRLELVNEPGLREILSRGPKYRMRPVQPFASDKVDPEAKDRIVEIMSAAVDAFQGRPRSCLQIRWPRVMRIPDDTDHRTPGGQLCGGARSRGRGRG